MADLSLAMLNQVLEAALALMILLLVMSVTAIVRVGTTVGGNREPGTNGDSAASAADLSTAVPAPPMWGGTVPGHLAPPPPPRKPGLFGPRYEARHVRGRAPNQRQPGPTGPPWGPAAPPPGLPQQGSERWI